MPRLPRPLIEAVRKRSCVAFVGAGLSIPAGAPSWREFLKRLIDEGERDGATEVGSYTDFQPSLTGLDRIAATNKPRSKLPGYFQPSRQDFSYTL
jgi:hypothetical protein